MDLLLNLGMFLLGAILTAASIYVGASIYAKASGLRAPIGEKKILPFVMRTDEDEVMIEKAYEDLQRKKYEDRVLDEVEGLGKT